MEDKFTSKEILDYITEQTNENISLTRKLSLYTKATEKNLEVDQYSLILWLNYIDILKICDNDNDEIRGIYKMLQAKFGRFLEFWIAYLEFERKNCASNVGKIIEKNKKWLEMKEYEERDAILNYFKNMQNDVLCYENKKDGTKKMVEDIESHFMYNHQQDKKYTEKKDSMYNHQQDKKYTEKKDGDFEKKLNHEACLYQDIDQNNLTSCNIVNNDIDDNVFIENKSKANIAIRRYSAKFTAQQSSINKQESCYNEDKEDRNKQHSFSSVFQQTKNEVTIKNNTKTGVFTGLDNLQINKNEERGKKSILPSILQSNGVSKFYSPLSSVKRLPKSINNLHFDDNQILNGFYELKNEIKADLENEIHEKCNENNKNEMQNKQIPYLVDPKTKNDNNYTYNNYNQNKNNMLHVNTTNKENNKNTVSKNLFDIKYNLDEANKERFKNTYATNLSNIKFKTVDVNKDAKNRYKFDFDSIDCKKDVTNQINKIFARDIPKQLHTNFCNEFILKDRKLQVIREIGKGGSCIVYQVIHDNIVYALKKVNIGNENETVMQGYLDEIKFLNKLKGKNEIITLIDYEQKDGYLFVLMEYGETDLANLIRNDKVNLKSINYVRSLWERMLLAVKTIHDARIVHRDLKPANFLLVKGKLKLIDFGISKAIRNDTTNINFESHVGTINYMAPEAVDTEKSKMGRSSDIWSLGCILYEIIYGYPPLHHCNNFAKKIMTLQDKNYVIDYPQRSDDFSIAIQSVKKCLKRQANERSTIEELLKDDFLNLNDKILLRKKDLIDFAKAVWKINGNEKINIKLHAEKVVDEFMKKLEEKKNKKH